MSSKKTISDRNALVAVLFLFQYSLLIPLMSFVSSMILIGLSGVLLIVASIYINGKKLVLNKRNIIIVGLIVVIMLAKVAYDGSDLYVALRFFMIALPPAIIYSCRFNGKSFLNFGKKLAVINFAVLVLMPFLGNGSGYMRFGYGLLPTVIFSYLAVFYVERENGGRRNQYRGFWIILLLASFLELLIYGGRGPALAFFVFILVDRFFINGKDVIRNTLLICAGLIALINVRRILDGLVSLAGAFGVDSYSLRKYQIQLNNGLEAASSGRGRLYRAALKTMKEHPVFGAKMVSYDDDTMYVHNLFLQVGRDLGVIAAFVSVLFVIYCFYLLANKNISMEKRTIISVFFCVSVVRLMVSSNIWERPEFWALVCIAINYKTIFTEPVTAKLQNSAAQFYRREG